jgi:hypothetical protein
VADVGGYTEWGFCCCSTFESQSERGFLRVGRLKNRVQIRVLFEQWIIQIFEEFFYVFFIRSKNVGFFEINRRFEYLAEKCYVASDWSKNSEKMIFFIVFLETKKK